MPPNRRARRVLGYKYLLKLLRISRRQLADALSQPREKPRDRRRGTYRSRFVFVAAAEMNHAPLRYDSAHLDLREVKLANRRNKRLLVLA